MRHGTAAERVVPAPLVASSRQRRLLAGDRIFQGLALASAMLILLIAVIFVLLRTGMGLDVGICYLGSSSRGTSELR